MSSPTLKRRRLSIELRRLRQATDLSVTEAAKRLDLDPATITRMERNDWKRPNINIIRNMLTLYGVTDEANREALLALARESRQRGWWADYADVFRSSLPDFESGARAIFDYQTILVPGMLQTADYARAIFATQAQLHAVHRDEDTAVQERLRRQEILHSGTNITVLMTESALLHPVVTRETMIAQLDRINTLTEFANLEIGVLPATQPLPLVPLHGFWLYELDDHSIALVENITAELRIDNPDQITTYQHVTAKLRQAAVTGPRARALLQQLISRYQHG